MRASQAPRTKRGEAAVLKTSPHLQASPSRPPQNDAAARPCGPAAPLCRLRTCSSTLKAAGARRELRRARARDGRCCCGRAVNGAACRGRLRRCEGRAVAVEHKWRAAFFTCSGRWRRCKGDAAAVECQQLVAARRRELAKSARAEASAASGAAADDVCARCRMLAGNVPALGRGLSRPRRVDWCDSSAYLLLCRVCAATSAGCLERVRFTVQCA